MLADDRKVRFGYDLGATKIQAYAEYEDGTPLLNANGNPIKWEENPHNIDKANDSEEEKKRKISDVMIGQLEKCMEEANIKIEQISFLGVVVPGPVQNNVVMKLINIGLTNYDILQEIINGASERGYKFNPKMAVTNDYRGALCGESKIGAAKGESGTIVAIRI